VPVGVAPNDIDSTLRPSPSGSTLWVVRYSAPWELDRSFDEQLAVFEEVISRYGDSTYPDIVPSVARAL
jgi:hypothetical protein